ncbi:Kinase, CMGC DYRK [Spironucleus salmonicida]|uniref:Kinase, CMGC DYRK n=1 Tax=Spironucleus salmonicida TaxID=348837 RepID=V6LYN0_9EUKA|nr:Kinase, CMGC DYRK [Spironucleus salmonicida]|eukprot:EST45929.1 Kinase, CMGC DYRK [Spironucleus salmonicida]
MTLPINQSFQQPAQGMNKLTRSFVVHSETFTDSDGYFNAIRPGSMFKQYKVLALLGQGSFGRVLHVENQQGKQYAAKVARQQKIFRESCEREATIMRSIEDTNITAKIIETFDYQGHFFIIMELLNQSLSKHLRARRSGISLTELKPIIKKMAQWFLVFKQRNLIHTDIKPDNIMVSEDGEFQLIDFGSAVRFEQDKLHSYIQSRWFRAPEVLYRLRYSFPIDMWSFGCLIFEMHKLQPVFPSNSSHMLCRQMFTLLGTPPQFFLVQNGKMREESKRFFVQSDYYFYSQHLEQMDELQIAKQDKFYPSEAVLKAVGRPQCELRHLRYEIENPYLRETKDDYESYYEMLQGLLTYDPASRWSPEQLLNCKFLK